MANEQSKGRVTGRATCYQTFIRDGVSRSPGQQVAWTRVGNVVEFVIEAKTFKVDRVEFAMYFHEC